MTGVLDPSAVPENTGVTADSGFVFQVGDWEPLRDVLARLIRDPAHGAGQASRRRVLTTYSWERVVDQLEELDVELALARTRRGGAAALT